MERALSEGEGSSDGDEATNLTEKKIVFPKGVNIFEQIEAINDFAISGAAKITNDLYENLKPLEYRLNQAKKLQRDMKKKFVSNKTEDPGIERLWNQIELTEQQQQVNNAQEQLDSANAKFVESLVELRRLLHPDYFEFVCTRIRRIVSLDGFQKSHEANFNLLYSVFAGMKSLNDWVIIQVFWRLQRLCGRLKQVRQYYLRVEAEMIRRGTSVLSDLQGPDLVSTERIMGTVVDDINLTLIALGERMPPDLLIHVCELFNVARPLPECESCESSEKQLPDESVLADKATVLTEINGLGDSEVDELISKVNNIRDHLITQTKELNFHLRCKELKIFPPYLSWQPDPKMEAKSSAFVSKLKDKHFSEHIASIQNHINELEGELDDCINQLKKLLPNELFNRYCKYYGDKVEFDIREAFRITTFKKPELDTEDYYYKPAEEHAVPTQVYEGLDDIQMAQCTRNEPKRVKFAVEDSNVQNELSCDTALGDDSTQHVPPSHLENPDEPCVLAEIKALGDETINDLAVKVKQLRGVIMLAHEQERLQLEAAEKLPPSSDLIPHAEKAIAVIQDCVKKLEVECKKKILALKQSLPSDLYRRYYQCFGGQIVAKVGDTEKPSNSGGVNSVAEQPETLDGRTAVNAHELQCSTTGQNSSNEIGSDEGVHITNNNQSSELPPWCSTLGERWHASGGSEIANAVLENLQEILIGRLAQGAGVLEISRSNSATPPQAPMNAGQIMPDNNVCSQQPAGRLDLRETQKLSKILAPKLPPSRLDLYSVRRHPSSVVTERGDSAEVAEQHNYSRRDSPTLSALTKRHIGDIGSEATDDGKRRHDDKQNSPVDFFVRRNSQSIEPPFMQQFQTTSEQIFHQPQPAGASLTGFGQHTNDQNATMNSMLRNPTSNNSLSGATQPLFSRRSSDKDPGSRLPLVPELGTDEQKLQLGPVVGQAFTSSVPHNPDSANFFGMDRLLLQCVLQSGNDSLVSNPPQVVDHTPFAGSRSPNLGISEMLDAVLQQKQRDFRTISHPQSPEFGISDFLGNINDDFYVSNPSCRSEYRTASRSRLPERNIDDYLGTSRSLPYARRTSRETREHRNSRETRERRTSRETRERRTSRETRERRTSRETRERRTSKETRERRTSRESREHRADHSSRSSKHADFRSSRSERDKGIRSSR